MTNNCCVFPRLFKIQKNGIFATPWRPIILTCVSLQRKRFTDTFWQLHFSIWRLKFWSPVGACRKKLISDPDMGPMLVPSETLCPTWRQWSQESFHGKDMMGVPWFFMMHTCTSGAKFEEHRFNISRDIVNSVFYHFICKLHDNITFPISIIQKGQYVYT